MFRKETVESTVRILLPRSLHKFAEKGSSVFGRVHEIAFTLLVAHFEHGYELFRESYQLLRPVFLHRGVSLVLFLQPKVLHFNLLLLAATSLDGCVNLIPLRVHIGVEYLRRINLFALQPILPKFNDMFARLEWAAMAFVKGSFFAWFIKPGRVLFLLQADVWKLILSILLCSYALRLLLIAFCSD